MDHAVQRIKAKGKFKSIHATRKEIKKVRALLKLSRNGLRKSTYRKRNAALREAAHALADARDAQVRVQTLQGLMKEALPDSSAEIFQAIRARLKSRCKKVAKDLQKHGSRKIATEILKQERGKLRKLKIDVGAWTAIRQALVKTYEAGRLGRDLAIAQPTAGHFHEWRKDVKQLWYYYQMLRPVWPEQLAAVSRDLETLGECLGDDHDLHLLSEEVRRAAQDNRLSSEARQLLHRIEHRQRELRKRALLLANRFYSEEPDRFADRFHKYWIAWRSKSRAPKLEAVK